MIMNGTYLVGQLLKIVDLRWSLRMPGESPKDLVSIYILLLCIEDMRYLIDNR